MKVENPCMFHCKTPTKLEEIAGDVHWHTGARRGQPDNEGGPAQSFTKRRRKRIRQLGKRLVETCPERQISGRLANRYFSLHAVSGTEERGGGGTRAPPIFLEL